ncbi:MAG TPA: FMN-binding negative transcriptional regulator [Candidatus Baltobacteraceae bacterium]|nr:FMN-binding negative transcriptional regulator [Candidatus Baltobacteraceae bacterium]
MYAPKPFAVADRRALVAFIEREPFGILVSGVDGRPFATHAPFIVWEDGEDLRLALHVAKANPHWRSIEGQEVLAVFQGPHAMISAAWYAQPHDNVPTWDYAAVHCTGRARTADAAATARILQGLVERFEASWRMQQADAEYIAGLQQAVVGIEIAVSSIEGAFKYSQNHTPEDRRRVIDALSASSRAMDRAVAQEMRASLS